jgi:hypothetical protein
MIPSAVPWLVIPSGLLASVENSKPTYYLYLKNPSRVRISLSGVYALDSQPIK